MSETRKGNAFPQSPNPIGATDHVTFWSVAMGKFAHMKGNAFVQWLGTLFQAKVDGKGLSTHDLTDGLKGKIEAAVQTVNNQAPDPLTGNVTITVGGQEYKFPANTITTDPVGKVAAGTNIGGKTTGEFILAAAISYQAPVFTGFGINGEANLTVPLGYKILKEVSAGVGRTFTWSTSNAANIVANTVAIRNQTAGTFLAQYLANDGTEAIVLPAAIQLLANGNTQVFQVQGTSSQGSFSRDLTFTARPLIFIGVAVPPTQFDEAFIRSLTTRNLASGHPSSVSGNMTAGKKLYYAYPKAFGNRFFKTALGTLGASLVKDGGVTVRTDEQITFTLAGIEYSVTASEQAGLGNTTYDLATS